MNVYDAHLLRLIDRLEIPKVYLDTVTSISTFELHGDVLLLEGYENTRRITGMMLDRGRTALGFIGDIAYARTNRDRYEGFLAALADREIAPMPEFSLTESFNVNEYYHQIAQFLDHLKKLPQGFVCASDDLAYFVLCYPKKEKMDRIRLSIGQEPQTEEGKKMKENGLDTGRRFYGFNAIPLFIDYRTVYLAANHSLVYCNDHYGFDKPLDRAINHLKY